MLKTDLKTKFKTTCKKISEIFLYYEWIFLIIAMFTLITLAIVSAVGSDSGIGGTFFLQLISTLFGVTSAALNGKKKKYAFATYTVYVILYGTYSLITKNYGEGILNLCFNLPMYLYTLFNFYVKPRLDKKKTKSKEGKEDTEVATKEIVSSDFKINPIKPYMIIAIIVFIPLVTGIYGWALATGFWTGNEDLISNSPYLNALATACCLTAVFLASKTIIWQWIFWLGYGIVGLSIWTIYFITYGDAVLLIVLNICFIIMNAYSLYLWIIDLKKQNTPKLTDEEIAQVAQLLIK